MTFTKEQKTHHLKIYPEHFSAVLTGVKRAELRKNDRDFKVGDTLHLMETPKGSCLPTGEFVNTVVTHIADVGDWLPGYVLLSIEREPAYTAPPAPVSVPDDKPMPNTLSMYAMDAVAAIAEVRGWNACRAAMLQPTGFIATSDERLMQMPSADSVAAMLRGAEPVSQRDELPGTQIKQVADLYSIAVPGGRSVAYSTDAAEASDCRAMGWSVQEFVKLERYQDAISCNDPEIPDGYALVPVEPTMAMLDEFDAIIDYGAEDSKDAWSRMLAAAWIKSRSAAPQQEA